METGCTPSSISTPALELHPFQGPEETEQHRLPGALQKDPISVLSINYPNEPSLTSERGKHTHQIFFGRNLTAHRRVLPLTPDTDLSSGAPASCPSWYLHPHRNLRGGASFQNKRDPRKKMHIFYKKLIFGTHESHAQPAHGPARSPSLAADGSVQQDAPGPSVGNLMLLSPE